MSKRVGLSRQAGRLPLAVAVATAASLSFATTAGARTRTHLPSLTVGDGETYTVTNTTQLSRLKLESGGTLQAPSGDTLTMTVNGVETGSALVAPDSSTSATYGTSTAIQPGTYTGNVVLTPEVDNTASNSGLTFDLRQALYVDSNGVEQDESALSGIKGGVVSGTGAKNIKVLSRGSEAYDGVFDEGADYSLNNPIIHLVGNGRSDFVGDGAAIVADGDGARLVVNHAHINNTGVVRTGVVAEGGSHLIVKNSSIRTNDGTLPSDYTPTVNTAYMMQVPWMLGIEGDVRATNLLGTDTEATYLRSSIVSQGWGALSTDSGQDGTLTAIDDHVENYGDEGGYGTYAIGNATENLLGDRMDVGTYATINRGGAVHYGNSSPTAVAALNKSLGLGLSHAELAAIPDRPTVVHSRGFGFMWHGEGSLNIDGGTVVDSKDSTFLDKGQAIQVSVDGSQGVKLHPGNGVLMQVMDNDDPGPQMVSRLPGLDCSSGCIANTGVYTQPTGTPASTGYDTTTAQSGDAVATFTDTKLTGDFYNGVRGDQNGLSGLNMDLTFDSSQIDGAISAATTVHDVSPISASNYEDLGHVTNTPSAAINNGVIVNLEGQSTWKVASTSYLSSLTVGNFASVIGAGGKSLTMTVNGTPTTIQPGQTYTGDIELSVS